MQLRTSDRLPLSMMIDGDSFEFEDFKRSEQFEVLLKDVRFYPGTYYVVCMPPRRRVSTCTTTSRMSSCSMSSMEVN